MATFLAHRTPGQRLAAYWLMAVGFAIVATAIVVYLYASRILPIAGPFALLAWLPMLFLLRTTVLYRRNRKWLGELRTRLDRAAASLDSERALPAARRSSGASDSSLGRADRQLRTARATLAHDQLRDAVAQTTQLEAAAAGWASNAQLTREVLGATTAAHKLAAVWAQSEHVRSEAP